MPCRFPDMRSAGTLARLELQPSPVEARLGRFDLMFGEREAPLRRVADDKRGRVGHIPLFDASATALAPQVRVHDLRVLVNLAEEVLGNPLAAADGPTATESRFRGGQSILPPTR